MNNLFLIAHKVRGEPAFDIAERMVCPECDSAGCPECGDGFWWIISTSGHRAHPWVAHPFNDLEGDLGQGYFEAISHEMPPDLPDHYPTSAEPRARLDISAMLRKHLPPQTYIRRRL